MATIIREPTPLNMNKFYPITADRTPSVSIGPAAASRKSAPAKNEGTPNRAQGLARLISIGTPQSSKVYVPKESPQVVANFEIEVLKELKRGIGRILSEAGRYYIKSKETFEELMNIARGDFQNNEPKVTAAKFANAQAKGLSVADAYKFLSSITGKEGKKYV